MEMVLPTHIRGDFVHSRQRADRDSHRQGGESPIGPAFANRSPRVSYSFHGNAAAKNTHATAIPKIPVKLPTLNDAELRLDRTSVTHVLDGSALRRAAVWSLAAPSRAQRRCFRSCLSAVMRFSP
jgi:hypothetical protein